MFRSYAVKWNKAGNFMKVSKQSQRKCFSSIPNNSNKCSPTSQSDELSALNAKEETILAGLKEKYDLLSNELQLKYSQEKQEVLKNLQGVEQRPKLRNVMENSNASISKEFIPADASPSLFKNVEELNSYCDKIYNRRGMNSTNSDAEKIVEVMTTHYKDTERIRNILYGLCNVPADEYVEVYLSEAGFGNALTVVLAANTNNYSMLVETSNWFHRDFYHDSERNMCAQDLYDEIDSHSGYNGTIFDTLLHILSHENKLHRIKAHDIAYYLLHTTECAKEIMIEKGFYELLEKSYDVDCDQSPNLDELLGILQEECDDNSDEDFDSVTEKCLPVAPTSLFNNDDEINTFCEHIVHDSSKGLQLSHTEARKIVELLTSKSDNTERIERILGSIMCDSLFSKFRKRNTSSLSAAGFGHALSVVLSNYANNHEILTKIGDLMWHDEVKWFGCRAQDLYDDIDSAYKVYVNTIDYDDDDDDDDDDNANNAVVEANADDNDDTIRSIDDFYDGTIFESLLNVLNNKHDRQVVIAGVQIAYYLTKNTKYADIIMIKKGFAEVIDALDISKEEFRDIDNLKMALKE